MTPAAVYEGLRRQIIELAPDEVDIDPSPELPTVWGLVMDMGFPGGTATLVALADDTTSLYLSNGGGIIGGGARSQVAAATLRLLGLVERHLDLIPGATGAGGTPAPGRVVVRALTYAGPRAVEADEDDLGHHRHPLAAVFHAAHEVITELRLVEQSRQR